MQRKTIPWGTGQWTAPPLKADHAQGSLLVTAVEGSDAWRHTAYGFVHDSAHALMTPLRPRQAMEVSFLLDYTEQFDQAGIFLRSSEENWLKAGVEVSDGLPQVGAVVTRGSSDWSVSPCPAWHGQTVTVRLSRDNGAITLRIRAGSDPFRLLRVLPWPDDEEAGAGPYCCSPSRAGLRATFTDWALTETDGSLHV